MSRLIILLILISGVSFSQEMTLDNAIAIALENNYSIKLSRNNAEISQNSATKGNAGLLPNVSAQGGVDYSNQNTQIQLLGSPDVIETTGAQSLTYSASIAADYTIYAGGSNKMQYNKLILSGEMEETSAQLDAESIIMQVASAYYNVLRALSNLQSIREQVDLSEKRLEYARTKQDLSGGNKVDVLTAQVDKNKDSVNLISAEMAYRQAAVTFNALLDLPLDTAIQFTTETEPVPFQAYDELESTMLNQNAQIQQSRINEQISMLDYKISKSSYYPTLSVNSSYSYVRQDNEGSFLQLNQTNGIGLGISLNVPIYTGGTRRTQIENAEIDIQNAEIQSKSTALQLKRDLKNTYLDYQTSSDILKFERRNLQLVEETLEYMRTQYRNGQISNTQLREAQVNVMLVKSSLNNARYNLRLIEIEILRLTGALIQENTGQ